MAQRVPNEARWLIVGSAAGKGRKKTLITKWFILDLGRTHESKYTTPGRQKETILG